MRNLSDQDIVLETDGDANGSTSNVVVSLDGRRTKQSWEKEIVSALCRLVEQPHGWDSYQGKPLNLDTGMFALKVLSSVMTEGIPLPSVVPIASGGVQFEWHQNGMDIELYVAGPYDCELSVHDHTNNGQLEIISLKSDLSPLAACIKSLVHYNRHLRSHVG